MRMLLVIVFPMMLMLALTSFSAHATADCGGGSGVSLNPTAASAPNYSYGSGAAGSYGQGGTPTLYSTYPVAGANNVVSPPLLLTTPTPHQIPSSEISKTPLTSGVNKGTGSPSQADKPTVQKYDPECSCWISVLLPDGPYANNTNAIAASQLVSDASLKSQSVPWLASVDYAREFAQQKGEAYALYFCNETAAKVTGQGPGAQAEYKKAHDGRTPPQTIFDNPGVVSAFDSAGISLFVKVPLTGENLVLADKWSAHDNTLIILAPNDEKLAAFNREECNETNVAQYLLGFKEKYKVWKWKAQMDAVKEQAAQK